MSYQRTVLAGLLASLLLLSEMAFAQRSGVRSGVIGNVPAHQRIPSSAIGGGYRGAPIGNRRRSGAIRSIHPSLTGLEPLPTFVRPPSAETCRISSAPRFQLNSDAVEWTLQIVSGQTCLRGLNHGVIRIDGVKLTSPPRSGQVTVKGPGFSYKPNPTSKDKTPSFFRYQGRQSGRAAPRISTSRSPSSRNNYGSEHCTVLLGLEPN